MKNLKKISELSNDELTEVFEKNEKLREEVENDAMESASLTVSEILSYFERNDIDYSISCYEDRGDFLKIIDIDNFLKSLSLLQKEIYVLDEKDEQLLNLVKKKQIIYCNMDSYNTNWHNLYRWIEKKAEYLANSLYRYIRSEYDYYTESKNLLQYFLEFYAEERMDESYYITPDYSLFQHIEYEKEYN